MLAGGIVMSQIKGAEADVGLWDRYVASAQGARSAGAF